MDESTENVDLNAADAAARERERIEKDFLKEEEADNHPTWLQARNELVRRNPRCKGLLQLLTSRMTDTGLTLEGPYAIFTNMIEREMSPELGDILRDFGIASFTFGVQSPEIRKRKEEAAQRWEQYHQEELARKRATTAARSASAEEERLNSLSPEKQFAALAAAYPRKSVYGEYFAKQTFVRLLRHRQLPDIAHLMRLLNQHKTSVDWNRDGGRWIPGLNKWLRAKPWMINGQTIQTL